MHAHYQLDIRASDSFYSQTPFNRTYSQFMFLMNEILWSKELKGILIKATKTFICISESMFSRWLFDWDFETLQCSSGENILAVADLKHFYLICSPWIYFHKVIKNCRRHGSRRLKIYQNPTTTYVKMYLKWFAHKIKWISLRKIFDSIKSEFFQLQNNISHVDKTNFMQIFKITIYILNNNI